MTYVTDMNSDELRAHIKRLQKMDGWHDPFADRLASRINELEAAEREFRQEKDRLAAIIYELEIDNSSLKIECKEQAQQLQEKDIALSGMRAKLAGQTQMLTINERERQAFSDQAQTLQVVAIRLGVKAGSEAIRTVPEAVLALIAERDELHARLAHIVEHATHAARSQLCRELTELFDSDQIITVEQVVDLIAAPEEAAA